MGPEETQIQNPQIPNGGQPQTPPVQDTPPEMPLVDYKDPKTGAVYKIPKGAMDAFNTQFKLARTSAEGETKKKYESILAEYQQKTISLEEMTAKIQQMEEANLSESERLKKELERTTKAKEQELKTFKEQSDKNFSLFKNHKIENDLISAVTSIGNGIEVVNPSQLALLLKTVGNADLVEENGNYLTKISLTVDGETVTMSPKEAVQKFLSIPENFHHIKNNLKSGGGSTSAGVRQNGTGQSVFSRSELQDGNKRKAMLDSYKQGKNPVFEN